MWVLIIQTEQGTSLIKQIKEVNNKTIVGKTNKMQIIYALETKNKLLFCLRIVILMSFQSEVY